MQSRIEYYWQISFCIVDLVMAIVEGLLWELGQTEVAVPTVL